MAEYLHTSSLINLTRVSGFLAQRPEFKQAVVIRELSQGQSNRSYLLTHAQQEYVLRINAKARARLGVDPLFEAYLLTHVGHCYPDIIYQDVHCLVTRFVPSHSNDQDYFELGKQVFGVHQLSLSSFDEMKQTFMDLTLTAQLVRYQQQSRGRFQSFDMHFEWLQTLEQQKQCICHMDLREDNIRWTKQGSILLDWEYARSTHPIMDLSCLRMSISEGEFEQFFQGYQHQNLADWYNEKDLIQGMKLLKDLTDCWQVLKNDSKI